MASPANPTLLSLVTEGLRQAGDYSPSSSLLAIYQNEVMEQLKNKIWENCRQPKVMQTFAYGILVPGQSRYSCPADFSSDMRMQVLTGTVTGTAQSGAATTLVMAAGSTFALTDVLGKEILIISGTGAGSAGQIVGLANNSGTITLTVTPAFAAAPDGTSGYMLIDFAYPLEPKHIADFYLKTRPSAVGRPREYYPIGDEDFDEFILDVAPDLVFNYGLKFFYYGNIMKTDLNSALMQRLYLEWRNFWIDGIRAKRLMENDDIRGPEAWNLWMSDLTAKVASATYGTDLHEMAQTIVDY